jgi:uncharacterized protein YbjT (DUF2867 family)
VNVLIFGATGMVGQGLLRECLLDQGVRQVTTVGRTASRVQHPKVRHIVHQDLCDYTAIESELCGFNACFFCLGIASAGMKEADYERITFNIPLAAAQTLVRLNPRMTFVHVSGAGADSSERGRVMWARIKGKTENALLRLPFEGVYIFRPGVIQPLHGIASRTRLYRVIYGVMKPVIPLLRRFFPGQILTTEILGRAMLQAARSGAPKHILESADINALASEARRS